MFKLNWHAAMQQTSHEIDNTFGEYLIVTPAIERRPNFQARLYGDSESFRIVGVFSYRATQELRREGQAGGIFVDSQKPFVSFSRSDLPFMLTLGDKIARCCDGTEFEITRRGSDDIARITFGLVQLGIERL